MASIRNANSFYVDAASSGDTPASFVDQQNLRITSISLTSSGAGDSLTLSNLSGTSAGSTKITVKVDAANKTLQLKFIDQPLVFSSGIWVNSISAGATATVVFAAGTG
jgi:hypothetical protein